VQQLLDRVSDFLGRFVAFPTPQAHVAATMWAAHAHFIGAFENSPRLAALSPEPESGKTRLLEVLDLLVPNPMHAINCTPAALFRAISDLSGDGRPTILYDEVDTIFGPRAKEHEDVRGLLNAGHRRGAHAYRCVGVGTAQKVHAFPAYSAVALAGIGDLPDTVLSRAIILRMRRRAPHERIEPFRLRDHRELGHELRDQLASWADVDMSALMDARPDLPPGIADRQADVWEPLIALADAAGRNSHWPDVTRQAAVTFVTSSRGGETQSLGMRLLADVQRVYDAAGMPTFLPTTELLDALANHLDESPWADLRGKPIDARFLSRKLGTYDAKPRPGRVGSVTSRGYYLEDLHDAWTRYLPTVTAETDESCVDPQLSRSTTAPTDALPFPSVETRNSRNSRDSDGDGEPTEPPPDPIDWHDIDQLEAAEATP
jgi:hypothetical protein